MQKLDTPTVSDTDIQPKKVFIRTFGCQMNEYDSDKMLDVLGQERGAILTKSADDADIILFNTCSVREKAQEKVFSDLGRIKHLKTLNPNLVIGVGGCVASQEGSAIVDRAPYVDIVFGPQTLHRLPELIARRKSEGRSQVDISLYPSWKAAVNIAASVWCPIPAAKRSHVPSKTS
jgi:tRNA-2-methylthio-N6-dimethylallyladenosine synthase